MEFVNKLLVMLFVLSILNVVRHGYLVAQAWSTKTKYVATPKKLMLFGISLTYIIMSIFTGITV